MRGALAIILPVFIAAILASTALIAYNAIEQTNAAVETDLIAGIAAQTNTSPELRRTLAVYRAFEEKRTAQIARKAMTPVLIEIGILALLFLFVLYGVSRPARRLSRSVVALDFSLPADSLRLREEGSQEIRSLIRSFNGMVVRLKDYESLIGDAARFRGWKEISRVIVHEVNNLLSPIETYAGYLSEKLGDRDAEKAGLILTKLGEIRDTLYKFRSLSHLPEPDLKPTDIVPLLESIAGEFGKPVPVSVDSPCVLNVDKTLFSEMIRNAVKNGIESGPDAAVIVTVEVRSQTAVISVTDDGEGMPEDVFKKAFDAGFTTKKSGLGIGLVIVRSIAQEHKASVEVESAPGRGTTLRFVFPLPGEGDEA